MKRPDWVTPARGLWAATSLLVLVGLYVGLNALNFSRHLHWVDHSYKVLARVERLNAMEHQAVTAQRTYLLTDSRAHFDAFWKDCAEARLQAASLKDLVADNPSQADRATQAGTILDHRLSILAGIMAAYDTKGLAAAQSEIKSGAGLSAQEDFDAVLAALHAEEEGLLNQRGAEMQLASRWLVATTALGIAVSLIILLLAYRLLLRENRERLSAQREVTFANRELGLTVSRLESLTRDMEALGSYAGMLQSAFTTQEALEITTQALAGLLPGLAGSVYLLRASKDHAEVAASWGAPALLSDPMPAPSDCWALRRNQPYTVDDARSAIRCPHVSPPGPGQTAAYACLPLAAQGESLGWLHLNGHEPVAQMNLALSACEQLSLALANLRLKEALRNQAIRDPLTGLFNRRYLEESLERELARCTRRGLPLAVLMLDIDHFKRFNDDNGHPGGDALLAEFGRLLQSKCRADDIACRYGGEEFTLILPEAPLALASERAEEIRRAAAEMEVEMRGQPLPKITVSIGISVSPDHGKGGAGLLSVADKALYEAKAGGRNRAVIAQQTPGSPGSSSSGT